MQLSNQMESDPSHVFLLLKNQPGKTLIKNGMQISIQIAFDWQTAWCLTTLCFEMHV